MRQNEGQNKREKKPRRRSEPVETRKVEKARKMGRRGKRESNLEMGRAIIMGLAKKSWLWLSGFVGFKLFVTSENRREREREKSKTRREGMGMQSEDWR